MLKWALGTFLGIFLGITGYFYWYLGGWKNVTITEKKLGPFYLLAKNHIGPYHKIAPVIMEVEEWAKGQNLDCKKTFGEYFDDPQSVEEGRLKSRGGCLLQEKPSITTLPEGVEIVEVPEKDYVVANFDGSPAIGPMKVYPKVTKHLEAMNKKIGGAVLEVYEIHSQTSMSTTYLFLPTPQAGGM